MAPKMCDYPGCKSPASLMRCYRCNKHAACEQHSRKESSLGNKYICFACMAEVDEVARKKAEQERLARVTERERRIDAERKEKERLAQYTVICPVCHGTSGWDGTEVRKVVKMQHHPAGHRYDEAGSKSYHRAYDSLYEQNEESVPYFEKCYLCNNSDGVPGKITPSMYSRLEYEGLTHNCPSCSTGYAYRRNTIVMYGSVYQWDTGPDTFNETRREEKPIAGKICSFCKGKKLVTEKVFTAFSQRGIRKAMSSFQLRIPKFSVEGSLNTFMIVTIIFFIILLLFLPRIFSGIFDTSLFFK